jgi:hypothetical protein
MGRGLQVKRGDKKGWRMLLGLDSRQWCVLFKMVTFAYTSERVSLNLMCILSTAISLV